MAHIQFRDLYKPLDDDLKWDLEYAWSLPHNPRFVGKLQMVQDLALPLSHPLPNPNLDKSKIAYIVRTIRNIVTVSNVRLTEYSSATDYWH